MNKRLTFRTIGTVLLVESALMMAPLVVSLIYGSDDSLALLVSALLTACAGGGLTLLHPRSENLRAREGFAIVALSWIFVSIFGALPFVVHGCIPSPVDAFFEIVSGFTTTGATILTDVERLPRGLLFWRSFTHWAGGMGVLVLTLALMPKLGARSIHLMRAESPGPSVDKLVPRVGKYAKMLYRLYIALSVLMLICLLLTGMNLYDALINVFGTAGTGGFSNYNLSIGAFNSCAVEIIVAVFMALFGINFSIYYFLLHKNISAVWHNSELKTYLALLLGASAIIAIDIMPEYGCNFFHALRYSFFQVSSVLTSTGFATADFNLWPQLSRTLLVGLMLIGACAGSTGGGIKVVRFELLFKGMLNEIRHTIHPKSVSTVKLDGHTVSENVVSGVFTFFFAYIFVLMISVFALSFDGFSFETNVTSVITALSNIGPGLDMVGPRGNFSAFSNLSKLVLSLDMLIGRLEIFPILMLISPSAWRHAN